MDNSIAAGVAAPSAMYATKIANNNEAAMLNGQSQAIAQSGAESTSDRPEPTQGLPEHVGKNINVTA